MKTLFALFFTILAVTASVCTNEAQEIGSSLSGSFELSGYTQNYFREILEDQNRNLLYFIGFFRNTTTPWDTIIYKSDHNLAKLKVKTYDIYCLVISYAIDPSGDFIYVHDQTPDVIVEIRATDLEVSRYLSISGSGVNNNCIMRITDNFYFSLKIGSVMETCRWDKSSTNLDCFNFGINSETNFAPISEDLLFFGSTDSVDDQYYLVNYNFSDPLNLVWKKSIACPTSGCANKASNSILSHDKGWIYTMILYDDNFIFLKLNVVDGNLQNSGLILNDSGFGSSYSMKEFNKFFAVQIFSSSFSNNKRLILINSTDTGITKEYKSVDSNSYAVGRLLYKGEELMYHSGRVHTNYELFAARSPTYNIDQLREFEEDAPLFTPITSSYQASSTTSNPSITSSTKLLDIETSPSITSNDLTALTNPSFSIYVALWNQDFIQAVQSNTSVQLEFIWACAQSVNYTDISFGLAQTGSNEIPDWVMLDTSNQELYLNKTPKLEQATTFHFSLQISFGSEQHYKQFKITVEECTITNCDVCQLGSPSLCETCMAGYQASNGQKSCSKITAMAGATEAAAAMMTSSVVLASASSILSLSSINSIFSIMNSMQLGILLPLVPDYFSPKVLAFLSGMGFTMFSFGFIKFKDLPFVEAISNWVSYPQSDEYLNSLGLRSGSSFVNYLSLMAIIVLVGITHLGVAVCNGWAENSKSPKCKQFMKKLFNFFTFNIYIRIFIQAFSFTTLSILSEIYNLNLSTTVTKVSFGLCVLFGVCTSVLFILSFYMYIKSFPQLDQDKYWCCVEYFNGVKPTKYSKLYSSLFMTTRLVLSSLLILGEAAPSSDKSTIFYLINIAYGLYLIIIRPFENPQDSIIEIINQILFCCLAVPLSWLNTEHDWTPFYESYYTTIFMVSPGICSIICIAFLIKSIIIYFVRRKASRQKQNIQPKKPSCEKRRSHGQEEPENSVTPSMMRSSSNISCSNASMMPAQNKTSKKTPAQSSIISMNLSR
ncbi:unnamed protein product [Moneuplotes crassus]|uniref:Transmembrane protein n=1 Tax=Euplotes crassus TaxID=5936 RepID=A0AAD1XY63_EUPCR|nr:unnamed protein product [Moneuplotes crassus]